MSRYTKKKKEFIGLSPFALVFRGQKKTENSRMTLFAFDNDNIVEQTICNDKDFNSLSDPKLLINWMNVYGLDDIELMTHISEKYKLESNILSDVMNPSLRPKVIESGNGIFSTIKILFYNEKNNQLSAENLSLFFNNKIIISFQEQQTHTFDPVRERIRKHYSKIRNGGHDYMAFALLDVVVDNYIYILGVLGEKIETLEEEMSNDPKPEFLEKVNAYKRDLNFIRKHVKPAREMIMSLCKLDTEFIRDNNLNHFKELQDNINEANDISDSYREVLYDLLNIYHSSISTRLNDIMRVLTVISVIFIPITFLVGVYGTNFEFIPELHWKYSYFILWFIMLALTTAMIWYFKRKKWF